MTLTSEEIQQRRPVWAALSELWLDNELSADDLAWIARVLAESEYTEEQLRAIYLLEVAPVVSPNLLSVAGEWAPFDLDWLASQILCNLNEHPSRTRFWSWFPPTKWLMVYATERHWRTLVQLVGQYRNRSTHPLTQFSPHAIPTTPEA